MFYQSEHSFKSDFMKLTSGNELNYPAHLHGSFEFFAVTSGKMEITVDKKQYELSGGEALLIFPNQLHAIVTRGEAQHIKCIFSTSLIKSYEKRVLQNLPSNNKFLPRKIHIDMLSELLDSGKNDILYAKGILYMLAADFHRGREYVPRRENENELLASIISFVENEYRTECTVSALAKRTSYHYVYLSRYFKECTGLAFTDFVNRYRIHEATYMLGSLDKSILDVALECGFGSLRSFNRNFKRITGLTPTEYAARGNRATE